MPIFRIIEMRKNGKGEEFPIESIMVAKDEKEARKIIETPPCIVADKNYKVKQI